MNPSANHLNKLAITKSKMWLQLLAFWHQLTIATAIVWNAALTKIRTAVGPAPVEYYLLEDGRVLPSSIVLPVSTHSSTYLYNPHSHRLSLLSNIDPSARFRRLDTIALSFNHPSTGEVDISDWLGEVRAHPVPDLPVKQLLSLWSLAHHRYVPLSDGVQVSVTKNDGETDLITFE
jgi:hypothetical protein